MLGRSARESHSQALSAALKAGWVQNPEDLLNLGVNSEVFSTVAKVSNISAIMHIGHPHQPDPELEQDLLSSQTNLLITDVISIPSTWVWVGRGGEPIGPVVVDTAGLRDVLPILRKFGLSPRLVPVKTSLEERIELAGVTGTLVIEGDRVPSGFEVLPGNEELESFTDVWYGLVSAEAKIPDFIEPTTIWLAFGPAQDAKGSLRETLGVLSDSEVDLAHLRSYGTKAGPHAFLCAFESPSKDHLKQLIVSLNAQSVKHRVLGVLKGATDADTPHTLEPNWIN